MNPLQRAIKVCGTQQKLADLIGGIRQSHVSMWLHRGKVPADYCPTIERVTGGAVRCEDLVGAASPYKVSFPADPWQPRPVLARPERAFSILSII